MILINKKQIYIFLILLFLSIFSFSIYLSLYQNSFATCMETNIYHNIPTIENTTSVLSSSITDTRQKEMNLLYKQEEKVAYLTFDDGPTKIATPKILDILKKYDVKATFFVIGYRVYEFPNIIKRTYEEGHFIANHGFSHKSSKLYHSKEDFLNEIIATDKAISKAIDVENYSSSLFRFPNGSKSNPYSYDKEKCKEYLKELDYCYIDWNCLNNDSLKKYSSSQLVENLKKSSKNKKTLVILMHDTSDVSKSYTALEDSILYLKKEGYIFKTLQ